MANDNLNIPSTGNPELTNIVKILTEFPVLSILLLLEMPLNNLSSTLTFVLNRSFAHLLEFCKFYGSSYCKLGNAWHPPTLLYSNTWESSFTSSFCLISVPFTTSLSQLCFANQQRSILCHLHTPHTAKDFKESKGDYQNHNSKLNLFFFLNSLLVHNPSNREQCLVHCHIPHPVPCLSV